MDYQAKNIPAQIFLLEAMGCSFGMFSFSECVKTFDMLGKCFIVVCSGFVLFELGAR